MSNASFVGRRGARAGFVTAPKGEQVSMHYLKFRLRQFRRSLCVPLASIALLLALPVAAQAYWGAIAVDQGTGATGVSYGYRTAAEAKHRAIHECAGSCRVAARVYNGYAALVLKRDGTFVAGVGQTKNRAYTRAHQRAHERSARRIAWVFSG